MPDYVNPDYFGRTTVHPVGLAAMIVLGIAMLTLPRRYAVWPVIVMACFIAPAQRIAVFSLNFDLLRVMVLLGSARVLLRSEARGFVWHRLDTAVVAWALAGTLAYIAFWGDAEAVKYKLGVLYDVIGMYFLFRCLVRDWSDLDAVTTGFAVIALPVAAAFLLEHATGRNVFAALGGVPEVTKVRDGRLRCQGAFAHAILAGCFWAGVIPLMAAQLMARGGRRAVAILGLGAALTIIVTCASSTPVAAVMFGVIGFALFPLRARLRLIRWGVVVLLVLLHLVMKQPVWHLVCRIDLAGGSTGWHRFLIIDRAIKNVGDWWLLGTDSTERWEEGLFDVTNQYILEGVRGGLLTLALFGLVLVFAFQGVGALCRTYRDDRRKLFAAWACGVALFVHAMNFIGVSYFGQINMAWYLLLAVIGSLAAAPVSAPATEPPAAVAWAGGHRAGERRTKVGGFGAGGVRGRSRVGGGVEARRVGPERWPVRPDGGPGWEAV